MMENPNSTQASMGRTRPLSALAWLVVLGLYLAVGSPAEPPRESAMAISNGPLSHAEIVAKLREVNPLLGRVREARVADAILRCSDDHGLSPDTLLSIIIVESSARPHVRSSKGAVGLMQVMPHMWRDLRAAGNIVHIESNIEAGCTILADNVRRLGEDDGISAYNWGSWIRSDSYLRKVKAVRETLSQQRSAHVSAGGLG
jgi:soluble lytic murein transglycosylase-like protein